MKTNTINIILWAILLIVPYARAEVGLDKAGIEEDLLQPCNNDDGENSGHQMLITNKTKQTVTGQVHLVLASYDAVPVDFEIPAGGKFKMSSCKVENRMGPVSQTASKIGGNLLSKALEAGAEALEIPLPPEMTDKIAEAIMKTQGWYPVCYKRIQVDYVTTMGGNAFSKRPAITNKNTYYYNFGDLGAGIVCKSLDITLEESNGQLKMREGNDPKEWKQIQKWKSMTKR